MLKHPKSDLKARENSILQPSEIIIIEFSRLKNCLKHPESDLKARENSILLKFEISYLNFTKVLKYQI